MQTKSYRYSFLVKYHYQIFEGVSSWITKVSHGLYKLDTPLIKGSTVALFFIQLNWLHAYTSGSAVYPSERCM
jgi:hypothetical protein